MSSFNSVVSVGYDGRGNLQGYFLQEEITTGAPCHENQPACRE